MAAQNTPFHRALKWSREALTQSHGVGGLSPHHNGDVIMGLLGNSNLVSSVSYPETSIWMSHV
jgi:hypothetical protein